MKEDWKVYIKGCLGRGKDVISALTNLGAVNTLNLDGEKESDYYFISDNGCIINTNNSSLMGKAVIPMLEQNYIELKVHNTFKDGDILISKRKDCYAVYREQAYLYSNDKKIEMDFYPYFILDKTYNYVRIPKMNDKSIYLNQDDYRLATDKEKTLFNALLREFCRNWNPDSKTLEVCYWKPIEGQKSYHLELVIKEDANYNEETEEDKERNAFGNRFETIQKAKFVADRIKETLNKQIKFYADINMLDTLLTKR